MSGTCADALRHSRTFRQQRSRRRSRRRQHGAVTLFVAYDDIGILRAQAAQIPMPSVRQQRAEEVLRALIASISTSLRLTHFRRL